MCYRPAPASVLFLLFPLEWRCWATICAALRRHHFPVYRATAARDTALDIEYPLLCKAGGSAGGLQQLPLAHSTREGETAGDIPASWAALGKQFGVIRAAAAGRLIATAGGQAGPPGPPGREPVPLSHWSVTRPIYRLYCPTFNNWPGCGPGQCRPLLWSVESCSVGRLAIKTALRSIKGSHQNKRQNQLVSPEL